MENDLSLVPLEEFPHEKRTISQLPPRPPPQIWPRIRSALALVLQLGLIAALSLGCYAGLTRFVLRTVEVSGNSMSPTLGNGDRFLLNVWGARAYTPERGDIIVLRDPGADGLAVKRIVALSGESILIRKGQIYVNNQKLAESYLPNWIRTYPLDSAASEFFLLGDDRVFVLGDNRGDSADSREYGPVPRQNILGTVNR